MPAKEQVQSALRQLGHAGLASAAGIYAGFWLGATTELCRVGLDKNKWNGQRIAWLMRVGMFAGPAVYEAATSRSWSGERLAAAGVDVQQNEVMRTRSRAYYKEVLPLACFAHLFFPLASIAAGAAFGAVAFTTTNQTHPGVVALRTLSFALATVYAVLSIDSVGTSAADASTPSIAASQQR